MEDDSSLISDEVNSNVKSGRDLRLNWIDYLRAIAVFAVVIVHVSVSFISVESPGSFNWWVGSIADSASIWCIPVFVMISGYLFLGSDKKFTVSSFYRSRIKRLLTPIIFWTLLSLLLFAVMGFIDNKPFSVSEAIDKVISGKPYYHLWYLYMLVGLLIFTPYIRKLIETISYKEAKILCIILFSFALISNAVDKFYFGQYSQANLGDTFFINWFLLYLGFYIAGYLIGKSQFKIKSRILWPVLISSIFITAAGCYLLTKWSNVDIGLYFYGYLSPTVIITAFCIFLIVKNLNNVLPNSRLVNLLSVSSLGIYLFHPYILDAVDYLFGIKAINYAPIISIPLFGILTFIVSFLLTYITQKIPYIKRIV